jgi:outer membrane lipoprotein SlyB
LTGIGSLIPNPEHHFKEHAMKLPVILALAASLSAAPVLADPPSHAPAHGYYKKDKKAKHYQGKSGTVYVSDYGIHSGRCNRDEIGAVIGGVTGAVIGSQVARPEDRVVGMVVGGVIGAVLGHAIGDRIDDRDRACMGHALELGRPGVPVLWHHDNREYRFVPGADAGNGCRHASLTVGRGKAQKVVACPSGRGEWSFRPR